MYVESNFYNLSLRKLRTLLTWQVYFLYKNLKQQINYKAAKATYERKYTSKAALADAYSKLFGMKQVKLKLGKNKVKAHFDGYLDSIKVQDDEQVNARMN